MTWQPGQSGNPGGRPNNKPIKAALLRKMHPDRLDKVAEAWWRQAEKGDLQAIRDIRDTIDGKPAQIIAGDAENPIALALAEVRRTIVDPQLPTQDSKLIDVTPNADMQVSADPVLTDTDKTS